MIASTTDFSSLQKVYCPSLHCKLLSEKVFHSLCKRILTDKVRTKVRIDGSAARRLRAVFKFVTSDPETMTEIIYPILLQLARQAARDSKKTVSKAQALALFPAPMQSSTSPPLVHRPSGSEYKGLEYSWETADNLPLEAVQKYEASL